MLCLGDANCCKISSINKTKPKLKDKITANKPTVRKMFIKIFFFLGG